jgi:hypothetical protein
MHLRVDIITSNYYYYYYTLVVFRIRRTSEAASWSELLCRCCYESLADTELLPCQTHVRRGAVSRQHSSSDLVYIIDLVYMDQSRLFLTSCDIWHQGCF